MRVFLYGSIVCGLVAIWWRFARSERALHQHERWMLDQERRAGRVGWDGAAEPR